MNYMKVQAPLLLNTFNSRHSTCAGSTRGPGAWESSLYISLAKFGFIEKGEETQCIFTHFGHFLGKILFGDTLLLFFSHEAFFSFLRKHF